MTLLRTRAPSEDSDQTAHSRSLIRIFTGRILDCQWCKVFFQRTTRTVIRLSRIYRLIWVFVGRTCQMVRFLTLRLIKCFIPFRVVFYKCIHAQISLRSFSRVKIIYIFEEYKWAMPLEKGSYGIFRWWRSWSESGSAEEQSLRVLLNHCHAE